MATASTPTSSFLTLDGNEYELVPKKASPTIDQTELLGLEPDILPRARRRRSLLDFIKAKPMIGVALAVGLAGSLCCFGFTFWVSRHRLACPPWALECDLPSKVQLYVNNKATVQGVLSAIFGVSVFTLAYATYQMAETTIWPVVLRQSLKLRDIDVYLAASRGSIVAAIEALLNIRGSRHLVVLIIVLAVAILLQINAIIVGYTFERVNIPTEYISNHSSGGGMGFSFTQYQPPGSYPGAVGRASVVYESLALGYSSEDMAEYRDFLVDRANLTDIGNITIAAAKVNKDVSCSGFEMKIDDGKLFDSVDWQFSVHTRMNDSVSVRMQPAMGIWVDDKGNYNGTSAWVSMVFANVNGSIEGGIQTSPSKKMMKHNIGGISALACSITVDMVDDQFCVGECRQDQLATLSTLDTLDPPGSKPHADVLNVSQIATWLAVAPSTYGVSIHGAQHMWTKSSRLPFNDTLHLPRAYTSRSSNTAAADWSLEEILNFIDIGIGALAMNIPTSATISETRNVTVTSTLAMPRLQTKRSYLLLLPPILVLFSVFLLAAISARMHVREDIPNVRLGSVDEIIIAGQTDRMRDLVNDVHSNRIDRSDFGQQRLRYGRFSDGTVGFGMKREVTGFRDQ